MKVVFFGTPDFAAECLDYLMTHGVNVVAVVTRPDKPQGRSLTLIPTPVKTVALKQNPPLPLFQPAVVSELAFAPTLEQFNADLFVVVAYGEILKQHVLDIPKKGCINLHASLLPKYRGAAPIQRCLINGESETGVTIMHMVKKMDAGDMIATRSLSIPPNMNYGQLEEALCSLGKELLLQTVRQFEVSIPPSTPQNHEEATFAAKIESSDGKIHWNQSASQIHNLIRGVTPHPGAWCYVNLRGEEKRLKILDTTVVEELSQHTPGSILSKNNEGFIVGCLQGSILIKQVQLEGKKAMSAAEFIRGFPACFLLSDAI